MEFPRIFTNAAGWIKSVEAVRRLCNSDVTHIVVGSFTREPREGNTGGTNFYIDEHGTSVNSLGLPNPGIDALIDMLPDMLALAKAAEKILVVSIAGFSPDEYSADLIRLATVGVKIVELNCGCPNAFVEGKQKPIASLSLTSIGMTLNKVNHTIITHGLDMTYWVKVSPTADPVLRENIAGYICADKACAAVVCTNTFPNYRMRGPDGKPRLTVSDGLGGMAGKALKPIALITADFYSEYARKARAARNLPWLDVIGCGGISSYKDVRDFQFAGCDGVAIGTAFFRDDHPRIFQHIVTEFVDAQGDHL